MTGSWRRFEYRAPAHGTFSYIPDNKFDVLAQIISIGTQRDQYLDQGNCKNTVKRI